MKTYKVTGPHRVGGKRPGEKVVLDLTEGQEKALIEAGHLAVEVRKQATEEATKGDNS